MQKEDADAFVVKIDNNGTIVWQEQFGTGEDEFMYETFLFF